jgi:predicted nuclease of predicted toxin-antitoxin system
VAGGALLAPEPTGATKVIGILGYLAHGQTTEKIQQDFPALTNDDVPAVIAFAAAAAGEDLPAPTAAAARDHGRMKIKLDENLPFTAAAALRDHGFEVDTIRDEELTGHSDDAVWRAAQSEARFLVTRDRDFSDTRRFAPGSPDGILLVRLPDTSREPSKAIRKGMTMPEISKRMTEY